MGLRGPAPKPTAIRIYEGNPSRRPLNTREPRPEPKMPRCPAYLDAEAKREWKRLAPLLLKMGVLTEADYHSLGNLCQAYSTMVKAQTKLTETGLLLRTPSGYVQQSPLLSIVTSSVETITKLSREFGMTPASRTRVASIETIDTNFDPLEEALCG